MASVGTIFRCNSCGNHIIVIKAGANPEIYCCGQSMEKTSL